MAKFLANENVAGNIVRAARQAGHDVAWTSEFMRGASDDEVLARALAEARVLLTFDKDFGEMAFRQGKTATCGIILLRPKPGLPSHLVQFVLRVLAQPVEWEGKFTIAQDGRLRVVALP